MESMMTACLAPALAAKLQNMVIISPHGCSPVEAGMRATIQPIQNRFQTTRVDPSVK
jgi:hypothetical protein